ncbi:hypothetical protein FD723_06040 [Nostoc sp. C052]|uniref:hypothetical protein n=1 Tax=Nostoc sp. C052 TaxID=2576902 RepID=UPI0015C33BE2|nr:hypothetical protein [Nostoc sp. C052]QLE40060.1 hypothetical protein FD723_06040 [Nostoc sp. C052]
MSRCDHRPGKQYLLLLPEEQMLSWLAALELLGLSQREAEVLSSIIQGKDNKEVLRLDRPSRSLINESKSLY